MPRHMGWSRALPQRTIEAKRYEPHDMSGAEMPRAGDGFPNGDPDGRDPLDILRSMAAHGITACCPWLSACHGRMFHDCHVTCVESCHWADALQAQSLQEVQCWLRAGIGQLCLRTGLSLHRRGNHWRPSCSPELCHFAAFDPFFDVTSTG